MSRTVKIFLASTFVYFSWSFNALAEQHTVSQKDKAFSTKELSIKAGDEVKFTNEDSTAHHLMYKIDGKKFSHKQKQGADPIVQKFDKAGKYKVRCAIHPKMKLKIKVE